MEFQVIWKMFPIIMLALWVLATFKFNFISRGQINSWIGITAITIHSNLFFYGYILYGNIISTLIIVGMMYRSLHTTEKSLQESWIYMLYHAVCKQIKKGQHEV